MSTTRPITRIELSTLTLADIRVLSSIEAERLLSEQIERLRLCPLDGPVGGQRLGTFWDPTWLRAPFEEDLTLNQLKGLDIRHLLQKRSMINEKVLRIAMAIDRAMSTIAGPRSLPKKPRKPAKTKAKKLTRRPSAKNTPKRRRKSDKKK